MSTYQNPFASFEDRWDAQQSSTVNDQDLNDNTADWGTQVNWGTQASTTNWGTQAQASTKNWGTQASTKAQAPVPKKQTQKAPVQSKPKVQSQQPPKDLGNDGWGNNADSWQVQEPVDNFAQEQNIPVANDDWGVQEEWSHPQTQNAQEEAQPAQTTDWGQNEMEQWGNNDWDNTAQASFNQPQATQQEENNQARRKPRSKKQRKENNKQKAAAYEQPQEEAPEKENLSPKNQSKGVSIGADTGTKQWGAKSSKSLAKNLSQNSTPSRPAQTKRKRQRKPVQPKQQPTIQKQAARKPDPAKATVFQQAAPESLTLESLFTMFQNLQSSHTRLEKEVAALKLELSRSKGRN